MVHQSVKASNVKCKEKFAPSHVFVPGTAPGSLPMASHCLLRLGCRSSGHGPVWRVSSVGSMAGESRKKYTKTLTSKRINRKRISHVCPTKITLPLMALLNTHHMDHKQMSKSHLFRPFFEALKGFHLLPGILPPGAGPEGTTWLSGAQQRAFPEEKYTVLWCPECPSFLLQTGSLQRFGTSSKRSY